MNSQQKPKYKFYATLLDSYQYYQDSESETAFEDIINKINRVPFESELAAKGTAFNNLVDEVAHKGFSLPDEPLVFFESFDYKVPIVSEIANEIKGAIPQVHCSALIETKYGNVELYGYIDELMPFPTIVDIKCTGNYDYGKFTKNWQHIVYPYCLFMSTETIYQFTYLITDYQRTFSEDYFFKPELDIPKLRNFVESFIEFIEKHCELITDRKIFALENVLQ